MSDPEEDLFKQVQEILEGTEHETNIMSRLGLLEFTPPTHRQVVVGCKWWATNKQFFKWARGACPYPEGDPRHNAWVAMAGRHQGERRARLLSILSTVGVFGLVAYAVGVTIILSTKL